MDLPNDPVMLLSVINMELRDRYKSLDELCDDRQLDKAALCAKLVAAGFAYDAAANRFA